MSLRIYWRSPRARCVAQLCVAATLAAPTLALAADKKPAPERVTAREAIERQFAAPAPATPAPITAIEAARILEKYHARIGHMIEPKREIGGSRADR